jgi:O-antigen/teichoic acid export membrane protein
MKDVANVSSQTNRSALAGVVGRIMSMFSSLVIVAMFSRLFSAGEFGVWMVLLSLFTAITSQDLGVSSSLRIRLAKFQLDKENLQAQMEFFSVLSGFLVIALILILIIVFTRLSPAYFGVPNSYSVSIYIVFASAFISLSSSAVMHGMYAYLEGDLVALMDTLRSIAQLISAVIAYFMHLNFIISAIIFYLPWLAHLIVSLMVFVQRRGWDMSNILRYSVISSNGRKSFYKIFIAGVPMFVFQCLIVVFISSDVLLSGSFVSVTKAGDISLVMRIVNIVAGLVGVVMFSYVGAYGIELRRGNIVWIKKSLKINIIIILMASLSGAIILFFGGKYAILLWTKKILLDRWLYLLSGCYLVVICCGNVLQTLYSSTGSVRPLIIPFILLAIVKIIASYFVSKIYGINGIVAVSVFVNSLAGFVMVYEMKNLFEYYSHKDVSLVN